MISFLESIWLYGERIALKEPNGRITTYNELKKKTELISSQLGKSQGMAILICKNTVTSIAGYLALSMSNIVPLLLGSKTSMSTLENYISVYTPSYLFLDFCLDHESYTEIDQQEDYHLYKTKNHNHPLSINPGLKILLTTSGSTGSPKLVRLSNKNLETNSEMILKSLPMQSNDIAITTLPFNYSYGLSIINTHLLIGATIQLNEYSVLQRNFWKLLYDSNATTFGGVPFLYEQIEEIGLERVINSKIRYLTQAGGKLGPETLESIYRVCSQGSIEFFVMYGQTEASARMSVLPPWEAMKHPGSIGKAIYPGSFSILPLKTEDKNDFNRVGELIFRGGNVALGYAEKRADLKLGDEWKGVLKTGDLAYLDEEGFPYIVGRISRFVKVRGIRFSIDDLETIFRDSKLEIWIVELNEKLYLVSTEELDVNTINKVLKINVSLSASDFETIKMEQIPRTQSGKVDYQAINSYIRSKS